MDEVKPCSKCKTVRPLDDFPPRKGLKSGRGYVCRICLQASRVARQGAVKKLYAGSYEFRRKRAAYYKKWADAHPEYRKQMRRIFDLGKKGLTPKDYDDLLAQQDNGCWICGGPPTRTPYLHIDHNHETMVVRGLLCDSCNLALGKFQDSPVLLRRAIEYLGRDTGFRVTRPAHHYEAEAPAA
jgi:Recombination endonuclease VII